MINNEQIIWAKTILVAYKHLGTLCSAIDKVVENTATNSFYSSGFDTSNNSTEKVTQKIIALSKQKIDYINLKVYVEKLLKAMPKHVSKLLILKFIKGVSAEDICDIFNMSNRTYYRKLNKAVEDFAEYMIKFNLTKQKLELFFIDDK